MAFLHVLHVAALVAQQLRALAAQAAQGAHGVGRAESAAQQAVGQQQLQPLAVEHVGLAALDVLDPGLFTVRAAKRSMRLGHAARQSGVRASPQRSGYQPQQVGRASTWHRSGQGKAFGPCTQRRLGAAPKTYPTTQPTKPGTRSQAQHALADAGVTGPLSSDFPSGSGNSVPSARRMLLASFNDLSDHLFLGIGDTDADG
jgi:hypothetical protein